MSDNLSEKWMAIPLKEITTSIKGKKPKTLTTVKKEDFVPYIDIKAFENGHIRQYADIQSSNLSNKKDILVVWDGARSGFAGIGQEGAIGSTILALKPFIINSRYLYRFLQTKYAYINANPRGTGIPHVDPEVFWNIDVPIPPLPEQHRIVEKLDKLLTKVNACKERLDKIPVILKRFRQSVLAAACSGRLTADWREKNPEIEPASELISRIKIKRLESTSNLKEKEKIKKYYNERTYCFATDNELFDNLPVSWLSTQIGDIGLVCNGSTPSRKCANYWGGNIPWVSSGEVQNNIIRQTRETISKKGFDNSSVRILPKGSVLLAMIGEGKTRGQSAILEIDSTINQNIAAVVIDHGLLLSKHLWFWLQYQYELTRNVGSGSGPQALNCQRVRELPFLLPPFLEQQEIVRRVEALFKKADEIEARYRKAKEYVDKLTQSILAKAFRGELVPQDPGDEPASVLLERIKTERSKKEVATKVNKGKKNKT